MAASIGFDQCQEKGTAPGNIGNGDIIFKPKKLPFFKPGKELKERVDR